MVLFVCTPETRSAPDLTHSTSSESSISVCVGFFNLQWIVCGVEKRQFHENFYSLVLSEDSWLTMAPKCVPSGSRREMAVFPVFLGPISGTFEMPDGSDQVKSSRTEVGNATEKETCNPEPCPVDCKFSSCRPQTLFLFQAPLLFLCCARWEPWGDCSTSCGVGQRFRTRVGDAQSEVSNRRRFLLCPTQVKSAELYGGQLGHLRIQVQLQNTRTSINDDVWWCLMWKTWTFFGCLMYNPIPIFWIHDRTQSAASLFCSISRYDVSPLNDCLGKLARPCEEAMIQSGDCGSPNATTGCVDLGDMGGSCSNLRRTATVEDESLAQVPSWPQHLLVRPRRWYGPMVLWAFGDVCEPLVTWCDVMWRFA